MATNKTTPNAQSVDQFLSLIDDEQKRTDSFTLLELMKEVTGMEPKMWGSSIIGFGSYHYTYESGREGDMMITGFSPRKQNLTIYRMGGVEEQDIIKELGKYTTAKGCLYIKRLTDVNLPTLKKLIIWSFERAEEQAKAS